MVAAHTWTDAHESQSCETSRRELHECPKRGVFWDLELSKVDVQLENLDSPAVEDTKSSYSLKIMAAMNSSAGCQGRPHAHVIVAVL